MIKKNRFSVKPNFGHFSVIDTNTNKMIVGYSIKKQAILTADGLNRIRKPENVLKIIKKLQTPKGYNFYLKTK